MEKNLTELVFILDRSGSMSGLEDDTIGGFNSMLKQHKALEGDAVVTTVLFDDQYELLHDRINIQGVAPLSTKDYTVRGMTALLDAMGKTINKIRQAQAATTPAYRADKVMFVIITDGQENASKEYAADKIKRLVEQQRHEHGWEFAFFGANMDAIAEAGKLGISPQMSARYEADEAGIQSTWKKASFLTSDFRMKNKKGGQQ